MEQLDKTKTDLHDRMSRLILHYAEIYGKEPTVIGRASGRVEIIGNHTDYERGLVLAAAIDKDCMSLVGKNESDNVQITSTYFPECGIVSVELDDLKNGNIQRQDDTAVRWTRYAQAVIAELFSRGVTIEGINILLDSRVPITGGVSSSAAYEVSLVEAITALFPLPNSENKDRTTLLAEIVQKAEARLGAKTGLLDQATSVNGDGTFFDFNKADLGIQRIEITHFLEKHHLSLVVLTDPSIARDNGTSGYNIRVEECKKAVEVINRFNLLDKHIEHLGEIRSAPGFEIEEFEAKLRQYTESVIADRAMHQIQENIRVKKAVTAIREDDVETFCNALIASGVSSVTLYGLAEGLEKVGTKAHPNPLLFSLDALKGLPGVRAYRNMGGGFNVTTLAVIDADKTAQTIRVVSDAYKAAYNRSLEGFEVHTASGSNVFRVK